MTWTSTLAWCAASSAIVAVPLLIRLNAVKRDLATARQSANLFAAWWERDSGKMLIAQAQLDLIHQQHVDAGRKAHEPFRALRRETTEKLMQCVAKRDAIEISPPAANPAAGDPAGAHRPERMGGRGRETPRHSGQDTGAGILPDVTPRASDRNPPVDPCRRNRAGYSAPDDTPTMTKGL